MDQVIIISVWSIIPLPWQEDNLSNLVINGVTDIKNKNIVFEAKDAKSITINGSKQVNLSDTYIPVDVNVTRCRNTLLQLNIHTVNIIILMIIQ